MMRTRIATAAVAASLVTGLAACSSSSNTASGGTPTASSSSASPTAPDATASSTPTASTTSSSPASAAAFSPAQLETMRAKVGAVFAQGVTVSSTFTSSAVNTTELAADFDSPATMTAVWGSGAAGSDRPMDCGMAKYNGVAIGAVQTAGAAAGAATVPVLLYEDAKAGSAEITVTVDPASGVIKGTSCGGAPSPADFPGIAPIGAFYGATVSLDLSVVNNQAQPYFTRAFAAWNPADGDYNKPTCGQNGPDRWVVALTGTTSASSAWDYSPGPVSTVAAQSGSEPVPTGFISSLAVDLGSGKIARVTCGRANPPAPESANPADYAQKLMDYYRLAADQKPLGVDAKAEIQPFFVSDAAFTTAWNNTGAVPLLCAKKVPGDVAVADGTKPVVTGSQTTFSMVTWPDWHPDAPGQEASKFKVVFDTGTMKISSITCTGTK